MNKENTKKLIDNAPWMFVLMDTDKTLKEKNCYYPISYGFECEDGWYHVLDELINNLVKIDTKKEIVIFQVKEKFGGLRFYIETYPNSQDSYDKIQIAINIAENKADKTCEICGEEGKLEKRGWWATLCPRHTDKKDG